MDDLRMGPGPDRPKAHCLFSVVLHSETLRRAYIPVRDYAAAEKHANELRHAGFDVSEALWPGTAELHAAGGIIVGRD